MFIVDTRRARTSAARGIALTAVVLLAGCGSTASPSGAPGVASVKKPSAAVSPSVAAERPLVRNDASAAERTRIQDAFIDCLWANGFPREGAAKGPNGGFPSDLTSFGLGAGLQEKIEKACGAKKPEQMIDRAERLNPDYADHVRDNVACLNEHGLEAVVENGSPALVNGLPGEGQGRWLDECERKAFAEYYSTLD